MTLPPLWPTALPRPMRSGYSLTLGDNRRMASGAEGPPRPRRGWSNVADVLALTMICNRNQRAIFERFRREQTAMESLPFIMPDTGTDGWALLDAEGRPILTHDGRPILLAKTMLCLFGFGRPVLSPAGVEWQIGFEVLVMP